VTSIAVLVPLKPDAHEKARRLVEDGPPFPLVGSGLTAHEVFLTPYEAVFVFDGPNARDAVETLLGEADVWSAATAWRDFIAAKPYVAEPAFSWHGSSDS
jgi:hypothetical protein